MVIRTFYATRTSLVVDTNEKNYLILTFAFDGALDLTAARLSGRFIGVALPLANKKKEPRGCETRDTPCLHLLALPLGGAKTR